MSFEIRHRKDHLCRFAIGFYTRERAEQWISEQRAMMAAGKHIWMDKSITADDFVILELS